MRLIDVDALMVVLEKIPAVGFKNIDNQTYTLVLLAQVLNIIKQQSTIERKTGKWIRGKCDQCGAHAPFWPMASTYYESDYCPNCGAEMRGDDHETD